MTKADEFRAAKERVAYIFANLEIGDLSLRRLNAALSEIVIAAAPQGREGSEALPTYLELTTRDHPEHVLEIGQVAGVPEVGDYVERLDSGWYGRVLRRNWQIVAEPQRGQLIIARVVLDGRAEGETARRIAAAREVAP